jgi:hypothetical protein
MAEHGLDELPSTASTSCRARPRRRAAEHGLDDELPSTASTTKLPSTASMSCRARPRRVAEHGLDDETAEHGLESLG